MVKRAHTLRYAENTPKGVLVRVEVALSHSELYNLNKNLVITLYVIFLQIHSG